VLRDTPSKEDLVKIIEGSGSADEAFFGYPVKTDGLYLQQDSDEFAGFVHYMATKAPPAKLTLDIGIASGGQTKFLRDYYSAEQTIVVDMGVHAVFPQWARIKKDLNSVLIEEIIGDSHAASTRDKLLKYAGKVDFAFVDGDHRYRGLRQDIFLAKELLREGGLMALHDTQAVWDCRKVFEDLIKAKDFQLIRNFPSRFGISLWKLIRKKRLPTAFNRATGRGKL
jgi:hypothetical protein